MKKPTHAAPVYLVFESEKHGLCICGPDNVPREFRRMKPRAYATLAEIRAAESTYIADCAATTPGFPESAP